MGSPSKNGRLGDPDLPSLSSNNSAHANYGEQTSALDGLCLQRLVEFGQFYGASYNRPEGDP